MMGIVLLMASCTEDYKDWAAPIANGPEEPLGVDLSVSPASAVDFATYTGETVQLFNASVTGIEGAQATYRAAITSEDGNKHVELKVNSANLTVDTKELENAVVSLYGRRPIARTIPVQVVGLVNINGMSIATKGTTTLTATPNAPVIEDAYYITGSINGWDNTNTSYELNNGGSDAYENPVFTVMIPASVVTGDFEFKVTPKSGLGGDWSGCLAAAEEEGKFNYDNAGGNMVITADPDALFYDLTFNMLDQTWTYAPVGFNEFIYEIGNESGWSEPHPLYGNGLGQYEAIIWLDGEFKFKPNKDNWDGDWEKASGDATGGTLTTDGGPNIDGVAAGFFWDRPPKCRREIRWSARLPGYRRRAGP